MTAFDRYGEYYDLFNESKDYAAEVEYLDRIFRRFASQPRSILEMGCGTGRHALEFAGKGYSITGIDSSPAMLERARRNCAVLDGKSSIEFDVADIRSFRTGRLYDVVAMLFHVVSYQTSDSDLRRAFTCAREHLQQGGILVFDCWYGPAVLHDPPYVRTRRHDSREVTAKRRATPASDPEKNTVIIQFDFDIHDRRTGRRLCFAEEHRMRYLFDRELDRLLHETGFRILESYAWLTENRPTKESWYALFVAQAV